MADFNNPDPRRMPDINTRSTDELEAERAAQPANRLPADEQTLMGEAARPRDPDSGAAGTTNPRSTVPAGSTGATGVVPPARGETRWLVYVVVGAVGIILLLLLLS